MFQTKEAMITWAASKLGFRIALTLSFDAIIKEILKLEDDQREDHAQDQNEQQPNNDGQGEPEQENQRAGNYYTIKQEITKGVLERSFMKPLKNGNREACNLGHKLELPIGKTMMRDINEKKMFKNYRVIALHKVGLVEKKTILGPRIA